MTSNGFHDGDLILWKKAKDDLIRCVFLYYISNPITASKSWIRVWDYSVNKERSVCVDDIDGEW